MSTAKTFVEHDHVSYEVLGDNSTPDRSASADRDEHVSGASP